MAVSLPTAADVRKVRETARKAAADRVEYARTPFLAVIGAGDVAVATVAKVVTDARTRATAQAGEAQSRIAGLPQRFSADEVRKAVDGFRVQARKSYIDFAARGEQTIGKIRQQPQVKQAIETLEEYTGKLDARVDTLVDDAHDAATKAFSTVSTQTRSAGEKAAQAAQRFTGQAASNISEATEEASKAVAETGAEVAADVQEAGAEAASETRSATRKAANRTAPKAPARPARKTGENGAK